MGRRPWGVAHHQPVANGAWDAPYAGWKVRGTHPTLAGRCVGRTLHWLGGAWDVPYAGWEVRGTHPTLAGRCVGRTLRWLGGAWDAPYLAEL